MDNNAGFNEKTDLILNLQTHASYCTMGRDKSSKTPDVKVNSTGKRSAPGDSPSESSSVDILY